MAQGEASLLIRIKEKGSEVLDKIGKGVGFIADKAAVTGAALLGFGVAAVHAFQQSEEATNELNQAMVNQGIYTTELADKYAKMATELENLTTFSDDQITSAQTQLQMFLGQKEVTKELTQATLDFAAAKKIDLASAAAIVGKSIGTETNALTKYGVEIDTSASKTEKMAMAIQGLNNKFGGQAEAQAKGLGTMKQLMNTVDNLMEAVGERLAPFIAFATQQFRDFTEGLLKNGSAFNSLSSGLTTASQVLLTFKAIVIGAVATISGELGIIAEGIAQLMQGNFRQAATVVAQGQEEIYAMMKERKAQFDADWQALEEANATAEQAKKDRELQLLQDSEDRKKDIKNTSNQTLFTAEQLHAAKVLGVKLKEKKDLEDLEKAKIAAQKDTLSTISSLQGSHNKTLAAIGKAAALTQIAIDTPVAISKAMAAFPPPFNFVAAGAVGAAMAAQTARVMGVQLAEGGIVKPTPGGTQATIGEGGQAEAVIPLDRASEFGLGGGGTTIVFNGPVLGDESQAMMFAREIDKNLLKLRQTNQSVAFEDLF
jgi:hypothetical protein